MTSTGVAQWFLMLNLEPWGFVRFDFGWYRRRRPLRACRKSGEDGLRCMWYCCHRKSKRPADISWGLTALPSGPQRRTNVSACCGVGASVYSWNVPVGGASRWGLMGIGEMSRLAGMALRGGGRVGVGAGRVRVALSASLRSLRRRLAYWTGEGRWGPVPGTGRLAGGRRERGIGVPLGVSKRASSKSRMAWAPKAMDRIC